MSLGERSGLAGHHGQKIPQGLLCESGRRRGGCHTYGAFIALKGPENRITGLISMNRLLNGPNANAKITGNPFDALALCPFGMDRSQGLFGGSGATDGPTALGAAFLGPGEARVDSLPDHLPFEFGEHAHNLEHRLARRGGRIQALAMEVQVDPLGVYFGKEGN